MPASFEDQLPVIEELVADVRRMEQGEKRFSQRPGATGYERELRFAGLAQRVAQGYSVMEGVLAFVARRIDRATVAGEDWHKRLILRSSQPLDDPRRGAVVSAALADELLELCQFRHVVRSLYPTRLDAARVRENLERLIRAAEMFRDECTAFAATTHSTKKTIRPRARPRR